MYVELFSKYYPGSQLTAANMKDWKFVFMMEVNHIADDLVCFHTKVTKEISNIFPQLIERNEIEILNPHSHISIFLSIYLSIYSSSPLKRIFWVSLSNLPLIR